MAIQRCRYNVAVSAPAASSLNRAEGVQIRHGHLTTWTRVSGSASTRGARLLDVTQERFGGCQLKKSMKGQRDSGAGKGG